MTFAKQDPESPEQVEELFDSDSSKIDSEAEKQKAARLAEYQAKKANKPAVVAKSSIILVVKPWDDVMDMQELERRVREIEMEGLSWGASELVPIGYGIKNLHISLVIEDEKVSVDELQKRIRKISVYVHSTDILSFKKI